MWVRMFYPSTFANSLNDLYFFYTNLIEFTYFLFIRTRMSLKYYPKIVTLINVMFLVYVNSYMYAA